MLALRLISFVFFFFNDTATTEIYTLSLHDALPISDVILRAHRWGEDVVVLAEVARREVTQRLSRVREAHEYRARQAGRDRKSTRLNSSHSQISYAVFCLKKKKLAWSNT